MFHAFGSLPPRALTVLTSTTVVLTFVRIVDINLLPLRFRLALPGFPLIFLRSIAESPVFDQPELPTPKSPISASPKDLIRFLVTNDSKGKTKIHLPSCPNFGCHSKRKCSYPSRLAAGSVNSTIGNLRSIFNSIGRSGEWSGLSPGNPAAHPSVKKYLASVSEEQAKARVSPRQAVPLFFDKFTKLCSYLRKREFLLSISPLERYIANRDLAFFCLDFYSGDRASDLGRVYN